MTEDIPPTSRTERLFLRMTVLQTVMTAAAVIISMAALYAAFVQAESARRQTEAAVWPYIDIGYTISREGGDARGVVFVENSGIGPARIRAARVTVDGDAVASWQGALAALGHPREPFTYITLTHQVMPAGQVLNLLTLHNGEVAGPMRDLWSERVGMEYCYCSVFDQCWVQSEPDMDTPQAVAQCPDWGAERFGN